ncbi:hypothetical protein Sste5346_004474 [Sporothrix stenoceras]|uniref:Zn(2)-C6 fungal-type domain-containing protein n=1 Tax=Sporothrix stenoceras TaxID=5173 RepID=A0ABR3Z911_9PEZI
MPSSKVKPSERRRCPQACASCKRRKERCDGRQPCSRCIVRGVQYECFFSRPLETTPPSAGPMATHAGAAGSTSTAPAAAASVLAAPGVTSAAPQSENSPHSTSSVMGSTSAPTNANSPGRKGPLPAPTSSSNANGLRQMDFDEPAVVAQNTTPGGGNASDQPRRKRRRSHLGSSSAAAAVPHLSRLIQGGRGSLFYIGDSANLCFLQIIRRLTRESIGSCAFTDDPLQHLIVESAPLISNNWVMEAIQGPPSIPSVDKASSLLTWFLRATNCILGMYDEAELKENMVWWLQQQSPKDQSPDSSRESISSADSTAQEAIFFLIFAIGAQASPEDNDELAEKYFNYGRYLTVCGVTVEPSISNIQAYILLSMYLLVASRRNASFMYLGMAVRAAYALGIHRSDINAAFDPSEYAPRERLWRVLRVLDLFLSTSLGRPPSTTETRDTKAENNYSASNDLCSIFEAILTQVYSTRTVSTSTIEKISEQHRLWTTRFASGLATDGIQPEEFLDLDQDGTKGPNIGLFHLKEAYYWTIMLLSRPFLIENISRHIAKSKAQYKADSGTTTPAANPHSPSDDILAYACVDSAIRTMSLLRGLLSAQKVPKRLPFIVNSAFVSALVLGFAQFGDLDRVFPIGKSLAIAQKVLALFGKHDPVSKRYAGIVSDLQAACEQYLEKRARGKMERHSVLIGGLFGTVEDGKPNPAAAAVAAAAAAMGATSERTEDSESAGRKATQLVKPPTSSTTAQPPQDQQQDQQQQRRHQEIQNVLNMHRGIPGAPGSHSLSAPATQDSSNPSASRDASGQTPMPTPSPHQHNQAISSSSIQQHPPIHQIPSYSGIDFTPPSTDGNDDFLGLPNAVEAEDTLLGRHHTSAYDMDDSSQQLLPHMSGLPDMIMAMSPRMLNFDSFDKSLQLFPTMDTTGFL